MRTFLLFRIRIILLIVGSAVALLGACSGKSGPPDDVVIRQLEAIYTARVQIPLVGGFVDDFLAVKGIKVIDRKVDGEDATIFAEMIYVCVKPIGNGMRESEAGLMLTGRAIKCAAGDTGTFQRKFSFEKFESGWRLKN